MSDDTIIEYAKVAEAHGSLASAQSEFSPVKMNKTAISRGNKEYKYGDLQAIIESTRPALNKYGIFISFVVETDYNENRPMISATPILFHKNGTVIKGNTIEISAADSSPHSVGSAMTYAKRYSLSSTLCVAAEDDDDGQGAMPPNGSSPSQRVSAPPAKSRQQPSRPATAPKDQSATNGKLEQFVDGKLNPKYQTANGLLSIKQIKEMTDAVEKNDVDPKDLQQYLNSTIYRETPIKTRYEVKQADFNAIMLLLSRDPKAIFKAAINDSDAPWEEPVPRIEEVNQKLLVDEVISKGIENNQFKKWLYAYSFSLGDRTDTVAGIRSDWYADIIDIVRNRPDEIRGFGK